MSGSPDDARVEEWRDGPLAHVRLVNPTRRNALTWRMYDQLDSICRRIDDDELIRVVVLRGAGDAFAAGTDIQQFAAFRGGRDGVEYERYIARVLDALTAVRVPVVGVVDGPAVGAGLAIAACCDLLLASSTAYFGAPIARTLGNCLTPSVMARLQRRLGVARTMAMLLTSTMIGADEAAAAGLVHRVADIADLDVVVDDVVGRIVAGAPLTLAAFKEIDRRLAARPDVERDDVIEGCYASADFAEGVAAFLEHRPPRWSGR